MTWLDQLGAVIALSIATVVTIFAAKLFVTVIIKLARRIFSRRQTTYGAASGNTEQTVDIVSACANNENVYHG